MSGDLGFWTVKPDQMQVVNPLLILIFIPLYEVLFYPLLNLIGIRRPLQKLTLGGILAGVAFVVSAIVEINLEKTYAVLPNSGEAQLRIFNGRHCDYTFTSNIPEHATFSLNRMQHFEDQFVRVDGDSSTYSITVQSATPASCAQDVGFTRPIVLDNKSAKSFFLTGEAANVVSAPEYEDSADKARSGWPFLRILVNIGSNDIVKLVDNKGTERYNGTRSTFDQTDVPAEKLELIVGDRSTDNDLELKLGGVYTLILSETGANAYTTSLIVVTEPNSMSMLWLIPQYVIMTLGEVSATLMT